MEFRNRTTGNVITETQFRSEFSHISFPRVLTKEILEAHGYDPVLEGPAAALTSPYQYSMRAGVEEVDGQWFTKYIAGPEFVDYTDENGVLQSAAQQEFAYRAIKDAQQSERVRDDRNRRLAECDWTQLSDAPVDAALWATYRQALRDVPSQTGFPWDVTWPEQP